MGQYLVLDRERDRRFYTVLAAVLVSVVYFHEIPLYWFLRGLIAVLPRYASVNQDPGQWVPPVIEGWDLAVIALTACGVALVFLRPKYFICRSGDHSRWIYELHQGSHVQTLSARDVSVLEVEQTYETAKRYNVDARAWIESQREVVNIRLAYVPEVVLYRRRRASIRDASAEVKKIEAFLGDVRWHDPHGVITARGSPSAVVASQREQDLARVDQSQQTDSGDSETVVNAWGTRTLFIVLFAGFGMTFWLVGGFAIVGGVFLTIALVLLADIVLTLAGFGQQPGNAG